MWTSHTSVLLSAEFRKSPFTRATLIYLSLPWPVTVIEISVGVRGLITGDDTGVD